MEKILRNRVAIITGAGRGVGAAAAELLAQAGASVVLASRTATQLDAVADKIHKQGGDALAIPTDVSDPIQVNSLVEKTLATYRRVDILVNNGAVIKPFGKTWETEPEDWLNLLKINIFGAYLCTRAVLPLMIAQNDGRIINISSGVAIYNLTGTSAYNSSKAALERFSGTVAEEVKGYNIAVTTLRPGKVDTSMQVEIRETPENHFPRVSEWRGVHQRGELLSPEMPGKAICWLASPFAKDCNGQLFNMKNTDFQQRIDRDLSNISV